MDSRILKAQRERRKIEKLVCTPARDEMSNVEETQTQNTQWKSRKFSKGGAEGQDQEQKETCSRVKVFQTQMTQIPRIRQWVGFLS